MQKYIVFSSIMMIPLILLSVNAAETGNDVHTNTYYSWGLLYEALDLKTAQSWSLSFNDITDSFAKDNILEFADKWFIKGYSDGTFRPNSPISRAEFLSVVMKSLNIQVFSWAINKTFTDIPVDWTWMVMYAEKGNELWIIKWQMIGDELKFRPNENVTRAEALAILLRAAKINVPDNLATEFTDIPVGSEWMIKYISKAKELGVAAWQTINWSLVFRPNAPMTRAEAIRVVANTIKISTYK